MYGCGGATSISAGGGAAKAGLALFTGVSVDKIDYPGGPIAGGTNVVITGKGFLGELKVFIGNSRCLNVRAISPSEIRCTTPPANKEGVVDTEVTALSGLFGAVLPKSFNYFPAPVVSGNFPLHGSMFGGTYITITGSNFQDKAKVTFGGVPCKKVRVISAGSISCFTPFHAATSVDITVTNHDQQSAKKSGAFAYRPQAFPSTIRILAQKRVQGEPVTILSSGNFLSSKDFISVYFQSWMDGDDVF